MSCPRCGSILLSTRIAEWRCRNCGATSPGWHTTTIEQAATPPPITTPDPAIEQRRQFTDDQALDALRAFAEQHGRSPSSNAWDAERRPGDPSRGTIKTMFGSWNAALAAAGLDPNPVGRRPTSPPARVEAPPATAIARVVEPAADVVPAAEPDTTWRDELARRYAEALVGCVETWDGDDFFPLCDRVERVLGITPRRSASEA